MQFSVAKIDTMIKSNVGQNGLFQLTGHSLPFREARAEAQGRNLDVGAETQATEDCYLLVCSPWFPQPALLHNPRLPRGDTAHSGLGLSHQALNKKMPHKFVHKPI